MLIAPSFVKLACLPCLAKTWLQVILSETEQLYALAEKLAALTDGRKAWLGPQSRSTLHPFNTQKGHDSEIRSKQPYSNMGLTSPLMFFFASLHQLEAVSMGWRYGRRPLLCYLPAEMPQHAPAMLSLMFKHVSKWKQNRTGCCPG